MPTECLAHVSRSGISDSRRGSTPRRSVDSTRTWAVSGRAACLRRCRRDDRHGPCHRRRLRGEHGLLHAGLACWPDRQCFTDDTPTHEPVSGWDLHRDRATITNSTLYSTTLYTQEAGRIIAAHASRRGAVCESHHACALAPMSSIASIAKLNSKPSDGSEVRRKICRRISSTGTGLLVRWFES